MAIELNTTLSALLTATISWDNKNELENSTTKDQNRVDCEISMAEGAGAGQINIMFHDRRTVTSSTPNDDIDLFGALEDVFGRDLEFIDIAAVLIHNRSTTPGDDLLVGAAAVNPWTAPFNGSGTSVVLVGPNSPIVLGNTLDGYAVAAGSTDVLRIAHSGGAADMDYDLVIIGRRN